MDGPSDVRAVEWHASVTSTNELAARAAREGAPAVHVVAADVQTAGRGRLGRAWHAPAGTSLMCSWMLRPATGARTSLLPLAVGVALAQTAAAHCPGVEVALKWPNDLLLDGRKAAGVLVEAPEPGVVVVGTGVNVDWRGVPRPPDLAGATSFAEAAGRDVDRWRLFAGLAGVLTRRVAQVADDPLALLDDYRSWCTTIGRDVRVTTGTAGTDETLGRAVAIDESGGLVLATGSGTTTVRVGDVHHVRPH